MHHGFSWRWMLSISVSEGFHWTVHQTSPRRQPRWCQLVNLLSQNVISSQTLNKKYAHPRRLWSHTIIPGITRPRLPTLQSAVQALHVITRRHLPILPSVVQALHVQILIIKCPPQTLRITYPLVITWTGYTRHLTDTRCPELMAAHQP